MVTLLVEEETVSPSLSFFSGWPFPSFAFDDRGPYLLKGGELHGRLLHTCVHSLLFQHCVSAGSELYSWLPTLRVG